MAKDPTIYERLTSPAGKALGTGAVTAATLLGLRGALKTKLVTKALGKALQATEGVFPSKQRVLPFVHTMEAKNILAKQINPGGALSKGNIALATTLGGAGGAAMANYSRDNYAENLAVKLQTGQKLTRTERKTISQIADRRKLPKRPTVRMSSSQKGKSLYWDPKNAALMGGAFSAALMRGPLAARLGMGAIGATSALGDTKYRQFIMAQALSDRLERGRSLREGEKKLLSTVKNLGAQNA